MNTIGRNASLQFSSVIVLFGLLGCENYNPATTSEEPQEPISIYREQPVVFFNNTNRSVVGVPSSLGRNKSSAIWGTKTDWSGTVEMVTWVCSGAAYHADVTCSVDPTYILVGGGAWADYGNGPGALLTASYPNYGSLTAWRARSKDHTRTSYHTLHTYAVGMRLKDVNNNYITRSTLYNSMKVTSSTSASSRYPEAAAKVPSGYTVIGGGGKIDYGTGAGNLLITSMDDLGLGWRASGHDLIVSSPATITAYSIGIRILIPGFSGHLSIVSTSESFSTSPNQVGNAFFDLQQYPISCYGGKSFGTGSNFRFLFRMGPYQGGGHASVTSDKDHVTANGGDVLWGVTTVEKGI